LESEDDFLIAVFATFKELKRYVEDRRWIEPFWDDPREIVIDGEKRPVQAVPKKRKRFNPHSIHFLNGIYII